MRRMTWIALALVLIATAGRPALASEEECAAEKKAVDNAEKALKDATEAWLAEGERVADALDALQKATSAMQDLGRQLKAAYNESVAAWVAFYACRDRTPGRMACEKERNAAMAAEAKWRNIRDKFVAAEFDQFAAQLRLDELRKSFRELGNKMKQAEQVLDDARVALSRCHRRAA